MRKLLTLKAAVDSVGLSHFELDELERSVNSRNDGPDMVGFDRVGYYGDDWIEVEHVPPKSYLGDWSIAIHLNIQGLPEQTITFDSECELVQLEAFLATLPVPPIEVQSMLQAESDWKQEHGE